MVVEKVNIHPTQVLEMEEESFLGSLNGTTGTSSGVHLGEYSVATGALSLKMWGVVNH